MKRSLKFRVWDKEKVNFTVFDLNNRKESIVPLFTEFAQDNLVIQQFTGQLDKNNVEIYEGDIVKIKMRKMYSGPHKIIKQVEWNNDYAGFTLPCSMRESIEVLGNIFENPELLK